MQAFAFLGLRTDADERAIKRAYAQRLKQVRPDEDPLAFQQLHENYQAALAYARWQAEQSISHEPPSPPDTSAVAETTLLSRDAAHDDAGAPPPAGQAAEPESQVHLLWEGEPPGHIEQTAEPVAIVSWEGDVPAAPAIVPERAQLDFEVFYADLVMRARSDDTEGLRQWLHDVPAFWSLQLKSDTGQRTLARLFRDEPPLSPAQLDVVLNFFDLDHVLAGPDPLALERLRQALQVRYELLPANRSILIERLRKTSGFTAHHCRAAVDILLHKFTLWWVIYRALLPQSPTRMLRLTGLLCHGRFNLLTPPVDPQQVRFWLRVADRSHLSWERILLGWARCAVVTGLVWVCGFFCLLLIDDKLHASIWPMTQAVLAAGGVLAGVWLVYLLSRFSLHWQAQTEFAEPVGQRAARLGFVPILAATGCAISMLAYPRHDGWLSLGIVLNVFALIAAIVRYRTRANSRPIKISFGRYGWIASIFLLRGIAAGVSALFAAVYYVPGSIATITLLVWLADLWKQRSRFVRRRTLNDRAVR